MRGANALGGKFSDRWIPPKKEEGPGVFITPFRAMYQQQVELGDTGQIAEIGTLHYAYMRHYVQFKNTYRSCSAGLKLYPGPNGERQFTTGSRECHLCGADGVRHAQLTQCVNIIIWGDQHYVTTRENNQERSYWEVCKGHGCRLCAQNNQPVPARKAYWPAGAADIQKLASYEAEDLSIRCASGCQGDEMANVGSVCPHCDFIYMTLDEQPMSPEQFMTHINTAVTCSHCGVYDYPEPGRVCPSCQGETSLEIMDMRLRVSRVNINQSNVTPRYVLEIQNDRILTPQQREIVQSLGEPFDFDSIVAPTSLDEQLILLNEPTQQQRPPQGQQQFNQAIQPQGQPQQHYVPYQNPQQPQSGAAPNVARPGFMPGNRPNFQTGQR